MSFNEQQNLRYTRPSQTASQAVEPGFTPLTFKEWIDFYKGVIPGEEYRQYNSYLVDWYKNNNIKAAAELSELQVSYLLLFKQLQAFFSKKDLENWYVNIDITNEKEILLAIPYFAKKLKEISLYYLKLRNNIKDNQIKYKLVGTSEGAIQEIQDFVLTNFTKKPGFIQTVPAEIWANVPELSSLTEPISLQFEELYDTFNYMDHSFTVPSSAYYNFSDTATNEFFSSIGLNLAKDNWVFNTGVFNNVLSSQLVDNINLSERILQKYLGTDKYTISPVVTSDNSKVITLPLTEGNNFFYWPAGAYKTSLTNLPLYEPVALSSTRIEDIASSSDEYEKADKIFIKTVNGIEGAWLRKEYFSETPVTMKCKIPRSASTQFRFPFPGFGLSGEDLPWTGYELETNRRFYYLDNEYQEAINNVYWSTNFNNTTGSQPLLVNETSLVDSKAYADNDYTNADKIRTWKNPPAYTKLTYNEKINEAWLYRFNTTDISIAEKTDSTIVWPFEKITPTKAYPNYIPKNLTGFCGVTPLSTVTFPFSVASDALSTADVIYKIENYKDTKDTATACAWLSGREVYYPETNIQCILQPGLAIIAEPSVYTKFVWHGTDNLNANDVFVSYDHQPDCKYILNNGTYTNADLCTCKQILYSPFGHPGQSYTDNQSLTDFIIEDIDFNEKLDLTNWRDKANLSYSQSESFGWFKTNKNVGWGDGQWVNSRGEPFVLRQGRAYIYYRNDGRNISTESPSFSSLVVRYSYNNFTPGNFIWARGRQLNDNSWVQAKRQRQTKIALNPGDNFIYSRQNTSQYTVTGTTVKEQTIAENKNSIWVSVDYATVGETTVLNYPVQTSILDIDNYYPKQYPVVNLAEFGGVFLWSISSQATDTITYFPNTPSVTFLIPITGLYSFSVTAIAISGGNSSLSGYYIFNDIPQLTALPTRINVPSLTSFTTPAPGFVLNTPLYGWNYQTQQQDTNPFSGNQGAKPIWAKSSFVDTNKTIDFPTIDSLGTSLRLVDRHNLISFPEPSDMILEAGMFVEYERNGNFDLTWNQSLTLKVSSEKNTWSKIVYTDDGDYNLKNILKNDTINIVTFPTTSASSMVLQTYIDNIPVEVFYNARNTFDWNVTATPVLLETTYSDITATISIDVPTPSKNLSNRYYPNIAILPTLQSLSSQSELGGYFIPSNLGVLQYFDKNYTISTSVSNIDYSKIYENPKEYIGGTGSTKQEQTTIYDTSFQDSTWFKEPPISGPIAGTIKKSIFKAYPKFIPYQSLTETNSLQRLGIITQESLLTPWTGPQDTEWGDANNRPISFTGQINVNAWADTQILKQTELQLENWCTDIYNNQYGLYKPTKNTNHVDKKYIPGELWVRKNSQKVYPAQTGLSGVFDTYKGTNLLNELTGIGIRHIDTFFDTLYIQTSASVIFEKIIYDYNTDNIFSLIDEARYLSLAQPIFTNLDREFNLSALNLESEIISIPGETWFLPNERLVYQSTCALSSTLIIPELFKYSLNDLTIQKIFPLNQNDSLIIRELTSLNLQQINAPLLTYNADSKLFIMTVGAMSLSGDFIHIDFKIKNSVTQLTLNDILVYLPAGKNIAYEPPAISRSNLHLALQTTVPFLLQLRTLNGPATFTPVDWPSWITLSPTGEINGRPQKSGIYKLMFYATNSVGTTYEALGIFIGVGIDQADRIISAESKTDALGLTALLTNTLPISTLVTG